MWKLLLREENRYQHPAHDRAKEECRQSQVHVVCIYVLGSRYNNTTLEYLLDIHMFSGVVHRLDMLKG